MEPAQKVELLRLLKDSGFEVTLQRHGGVNGGDLVMVDLTNRRVAQWEVEYILECNEWMGIPFCHFGRQIFFPNTLYIEMM